MKNCYLFANFQHCYYRTKNLPGSSPRLFEIFQGVSSDGFCDSEVKIIAHVCHWLTPVHIEKSKIARMGCLFSTKTVRFREELSEMK